MPYTINDYALQCRHVIPALNARADWAFTTARQIASQFPGHGCMNAWMTSQLNVALIRRLRGSLMCLAYFSNMLFRGVCTSWNWQTSGRLVQELNVCTALSQLKP